MVIYTDADGEHRTLTSDGEGVLALRATDRWAWLGTETPGYIPSALLSLDDEAVQLQTSRPKTLLIKTVQNGQPVDADVRVTQRTHERGVRTSGGSVRVEGLSFETVASLQRYFELQGSHWPTDVRHISFRASMSQRARDAAFLFEKNLSLAPAYLLQ